jgi:hypothetical protein
MLRHASLQYSEIHTPLFMFCLSLSRTLMHVRNPGAEKGGRSNFCWLLSHGRQILTFYLVKICSFNIQTSFLTIIPTIFTNFSNLFLEWNCTCFRQFFCPSSGVFHCTHSNDICYTNLLTAASSCQQYIRIYIFIYLPTDTSRSFYAFYKNIQWKK